MSFTLFDLVLFTDPKQCATCSFIRERQSRKICYKSTQLIENKVRIYFDVLLELLFLCLDYTFENLGTSFEDIVIARRCKSLLKKVSTSILFVNLFFSFLTSISILNFEP